jgi:hypothetical protein
VCETLAFVAPTHDRRGRYSFVPDRVSSRARLHSPTALLDVDVIAIDEGQFFPGRRFPRGASPCLFSVRPTHRPHLRSSRCADLAEFSEAQANRGRIVIISALDGTFERKVVQTCAAVQRSFDGYDRGSARALNRSFFFCAFLSPPPPAPLQAFAPVLALIPLFEQVLKLSGASCAAPLHRFCLRVASAVFFPLLISCVCVCVKLAVCMVCHKEAAFTTRLGSETKVEVIGGSDKYLSTCRKCFGRPVADPPVDRESAPQSGERTESVDDASTSRRGRNDAGDRATPSAGLKSAPPSP